MAKNAVSPWEGTLVWVGEVKEGTGRNGLVWKSVDFTLRYYDQRMNEKNITFNLFGADRVERLLATPIGTNLTVTWWPESSAGKDGRYWPKNTVLAFGLAQTEEKAAEAPARHEDKTPDTFNATLPSPGDDDLPF